MIIQFGEAYKILTTRFATAQGEGALHEQEATLCVSCRETRPWTACSPVSMSSKEQSGRWPTQYCDKLC